MNRTDLQQLAELRVKEAECLLSASHWDGAYYLCGYAIECALKACIAKMTREGDFPNKDLIIQSYTHDLKTLVRAAKLEDALKGRCDQDPQFESYWTTVKDWRETSRYHRHDEQTARALIKAVNDPQEGVLIWLKGLW